MTAADRLLDHFDRIAGSEPQFVLASDEGTHPAIHVAIYRGFPEPKAFTGFTIGLSHFHPPGGAHKELMVSMCDANDAWALACGVLAFQLRESCPFEFGDTIDFGEQIAPPSPLSAFVVITPRRIPAADAVVDLGVRRVELVQLIPLHAKEREWLIAGGELRTLLEANSEQTLLDPQRKPFVARRRRPRSG